MEDYYTMEHARLSRIHDRTKKKRIKKKMMKRLFQLAYNSIIEPNLRTRAVNDLKRPIEVEMANLSMPSEELIEVDEGPIHIIENENSIVIGTDAPLREYRYLKSFD